MIGKNYYDVTEWNVGNAYEDIGEVINSILADIKKRQVNSDVEDGSGMENPENTYTNGKTGIYIAGPQDSFRITGMGTGFQDNRQSDGSRL